MIDSAGPHAMDLPDKADGGQVRRCTVNGAGPVGVTVSPTPAWRPTTDSSSRSCLSPLKAAQGKASRPMPAAVAAQGLI